MNHEVVVIQHRTGNALYLGSVANFTYYTSPPTPPVSTNFLGLFISPPLSYRPPHQYRLSPYTLSFVPAPHFLSCCEALFTFNMDAARPHHLPASAARICALRRMPGSSAMSHDCTTPPFMTSACSQVPVSPWGVHLLWEPLQLFAPASPSLSALPSPMFSGVWFLLSGGFSL